MLKIGDRVRYIGKVEGPLQTGDEGTLLYFYDHPDHERVAVVRFTRFGFKLHAFVGVLEPIFSKEESQYNASMWDKLAE